MRDIVFQDQSDYFCSSEADQSLKSSLIGGDSNKLRQWCFENPDRLRLALDWIHPHHNVQRDIVELAMIDRQKLKEEERHSKVIERLEAIEKPHWTMTPGFWVSVGGFVLAGIADWFAWLSIPRPTLPAAGSPPNASSTQQPAATPSVPEK